MIVGVNIGKTKVVPAQEAAADYAASTRAVAGVADYVVVNVSSPNTPGLRDLQAVGRLRPVLVAVRDALDASVAERRVPLLVKIAPDLADADVDAVADLALELGLDGIIATNTTISRDGLASSPSEVAAAGAGGLSGPPLRDRALAVLVRLRAGATLVQAYTGYPLLRADRVATAFCAHRRGSPPLRRPGRRPAPVHPRCQAARPAAGRHRPVARGARYGNLPVRTRR